MVDMVNKKVENLHSVTFNVNVGVSNVMLTKHNHKSSTNKTIISREATQKLITDRLEVNNIK